MIAPPTHVSFDEVILKDEPQKLITKMTTIDDTMAASSDGVDLKEKLPWTIDR